MVRWTGHIALVVKYRREVDAKFWLENMKERDHYEYIGIDGRRII
jgi:hypothetical protein